MILRPPRSKLPATPVPSTTRFRPAVVADRPLPPGAELVERVARTISDGRARGRGGRAVDIGRAEVDVDLLDQLGIELLVRIERVIARIVERDAVEGLRDAAVVEPAHGERAARRSERTVVLDADARQHVDDVVPGLAGHQSGRAYRRERVG